MGGGSSCAHSTVTTSRIQRTKELVEDVLCHRHVAAACARCQECSASPGVWLHTKFCQPRQLLHGLFKLSLLSQLFDAPGHGLQHFPLTLCITLLLLCLRRAQQAAACEWNQYCTNLQHVHAHRLHHHMRRTCCRARGAEWGARRQGRLCVCCGLA